MRKQSQFKLNARWFTTNRGVFRDVLIPLKGTIKTYLEIGVYEGRSMLWMLQNILTEPECRVIGIDPWGETPKWSAEKMQGIYEHACHNVAGFGDKVSLIRESSANVPALVPDNWADICYIDGDHATEPCYRDAVNCWPKIKIGGYVIFDDYKHHKRRKGVVRVAVDRWLEESNGQHEPWFVGRYCIGFRKIS